MTARGHILEEWPKARHHHSPSSASPTKAGFDRSPSSGCKTTLLALTLSGLVSVHAHAGSTTEIALGLSHAVCEALAFQLIERAQDVSRHHKQQYGGTVGYLTASGTGADDERGLFVLRDVSVAGAITTALAVTLEGVHFGGLINYGLISHVLSQGVLSTMYALGTVLLHMIVFAATVLMVSECVCVCE